MVMVQGGPPGRSPMGAMHAEWLLEPRIVFFFLQHHSGRGVHYGSCKIYIYHIVAVAELAASVQ